MKNRRDLRPDAQPFDEVRLIVVPRYKTSGLSGDEWRISTAMQLYRKGQLKHEETISHNMTDAWAFLAWKATVAGENGAQYFAGEKDFCDQEGCSKKATTLAKKKFDWSRDGVKSEIPSSAYRLFCDEHKTRGNCGLDDADNNYSFIEYIGGKLNE